MSYTEYLKLYTRNSNNRGRFAKRGRKNNYWIHSLKVNDKVDVFDGQYNKCWHITTILQIEHKDNLTKIYIHYDGWEDNYNEWITINHSQVTSTKLKKLHTFTPYHAYLLDPSIVPCRWYKSSMYKKCDICTRKCCTTCLILGDDDSGNYQCKVCMDTIEYRQLFDAIYKSLYNQYDIDINIIHLISDYSKGILVLCSNKTDICYNDICYGSKFNFEMDVKQAAFVWFNKCMHCMRIFCAKCEPHACLDVTQINQR